MDQYMDEKEQDKIIIKNYEKLIDDMEEINKLFDPTMDYEQLINKRKDKIKELLDYTYLNIEFVKRHERFRIDVIRKILKWYFSGNKYEKEIANEYKFLLEHLRNKVLYWK